MSMQRLQEEAKGFGTQQMQATVQARQVAAMQLVCGIDLSAAIETRGEEQASLIRRLERILERERLKGMRRHWSYDLNRHIALKQVLDRLRETQPNRPDLHEAQCRNRRTKQKRRPKAPCNVE